MSGQIELFPRDMRTVFAAGGLSPEQCVVAAEFYARTEGMSMAQVSEFFTVRWPREVARMAKQKPAARTLHNRNHPCDGPASNSSAGNLVRKEPSNG